jgi:hypothetical protein
VQNGGTLIYQDAIKWLNKNELTALTLKDSKLEAKEITFEQTDDIRSAKMGAIFETKLDLSHPINFGMPRNTLPILEILQS